MLPSADPPFVRPVPAVGCPVDQELRRWDRLLWGVHFIGSARDKTPMLIGGLWADDLGGKPYAGEPTRALLFCTRAQARDWCAETMRKWRDGRHRDDCVTRWALRPVRVRETVMEALIAPVAAELNRE